MQNNRKRQTVTRIITGTGLKDGFASRCLAVYFLIGTAALLLWKKRGLGAVTDWKALLQSASFAKLSCWFIAGFCLATLVYTLLYRRGKAAEAFDPALLTGGVLCFGCVLVWRTNDVYLLTGVCLVSLPFLVYGASGYLRRRSRGKNISGQITVVSSEGKNVIVICIMTAAVACFVCATSVAKHKIFATTCYDMGIFAQMFHSLAKDLTAVTTCERGYALSHFRVHASYILYLLVPFYKLFPDENLLLVAQGLLAVSGIVPFYLIAKRRGFRDKTLLCVCAVYLFSVGVFAPCWYHFHENAFLPPLLLWLLYAAEKRKLPLFFLFAALVCLVKEDAPLYVICIALYLVFEEKGRNRYFAAFTASAAALYLLLITGWLTEHGDGEMMTSSRFGILMTDPSQGLTDIVKNTLCDPGYFFSLLIREKSLILVVELFLPLLFLPFMTKKLHRFLLTLPFVIMNLVVGAGYGYAAELGYQYTFGPAVLLLYLAVLNLADFAPGRKVVFSAAAAALSLLAACSLLGNQISNLEYYAANRSHYEALEACLDSVPDDGAVLAATYYQPHIADRDEVYSIGDASYETDGETVTGLKDLDKYKYVVLNRKDGKNAAVIPGLERAGFTVFSEGDNEAVVYCRP